MRINSCVIVASPRLYLVPYSEHHVKKYNAWMENPSLQAATSSEPLSLNEVGTTAFQSVVDVSFIFIA